MKTRMTFEQAKQRLHKHYQNMARSKLKKEKKFLETPTNELDFGRSA